MSKALKIFYSLLEEKNMEYKGGIYHQTQVAFAYNSNRIEGSKLSEEQTRGIFETDTILTNSDEIVKIDDVIEMKNHFKLFDFMIETIQKPLDEALIKKFHRILETGTSKEKLSWFNVGDYKSAQNVVGDIETSLPENVSSDMNELLKSYAAKRKIRIEEIADFHFRFECIHPFQDGNGRVGRMIMFRECLVHDLTPLIILNDDKSFYYRGLAEYTRMKGYLVDTLKLSQDTYEEVCKRLVYPKYKKEDLEI